MQDISEIKKELLGFEEIELPYQLNPSCSIKYITLKDDEEFFFTGGHFVRMGFDKMIIKKDKKTTSVPTVYKSPCGKILYRTRFFLLEESEGCLKDKKELAEAVEQVQREAQERQAEQVDAMAPEAQPGLPFGLFHHPGGLVQPGRNSDRRR